MTQDTNATGGAAIKRYKIGYHADEWGVRSSTLGGITGPSGQWVPYKDHIAALASHGQAPAQAAPACLTCNNHGAVGNILTAEPCPDCTQKVAPATVALTEDQKDALYALDALAQRGIKKSVGELIAWLDSAAPTTQPAPANATAPSYDTLQLYKDLQDLWAEANAVDTVIGRPEVLMAKITKMRDAVGQMTATYLPAPQQEASPTAGMTIAQRILHVGGRNNAAGYVEFGSIQAVEALVRQVLRDLKPSPASQGDALDAALYRWLCDEASKPTPSITVGIWGEGGNDHAGRIGKSSSDADAAIRAARAAQEGKQCV